MQRLRILNSKETKGILGMLQERWGFSGKLDFVFMMNPKNKIYLVSRDIARVDLERLRVDSIGMYFGERIGDDIRLSIEGSQIVGRGSSKNILDLSDSELKSWLGGADLERESGSESSRESGGFGFFLVRHNQDFIGCGKAGQGKVYNYIGKSRRISSVISVD